ncbi:MAG: cytochrome c oxidase subunit II [Actinomycetes bacterium]
MSSEHRHERHGHRVERHEQKRQLFSEEIEGLFQGGPIWKRPAGKVGIIWLLMTIVGVVIGLVVPSHILPVERATEAHHVTLTIVAFTVVAAPVAAFVYAAALYSLIAWRKKQPTNGEPPPDGPPIRGRTVPSAIWMSVSLVLVAFLLIWGMSELATDVSPQANSIRVKVTGQQWLWTFSYPGTKIESRELVIPESRQVVFNVTSLDVTHGFWPVQLGVQIDANPGLVTTIMASPSKLGPIDIRCTQLCGLEHAYMYTHGRIVTDKQFSAWLKRHGATPAQVASYRITPN